MPTDTEQHRQTFRLEVNEPVVAQLDSDGRRLKLTLLDISEGGCRLRSTACLPVDTLSFDWTGPSKEPLRLHGSIAMAKIVDKVPEYGIDFDMPMAERDKLAAQLHEIQRRQAFKATEATSGESLRTQRQAYRAAVKFPISVKLVGRGREVAGEANDLSVGGLLLTVAIDLEEGTVVEAIFDLPIDSVDLDMETREVLEQTPFGQRKVKKKVPVRPFEPIEAKLKIVKRVGSTPTGYSFGTAFTDLIPFVQEEVARFIHAYQITQLRRAAAKDK